MKRILLHDEKRDCSGVGKILEQNQFSVLMPKTVEEAVVMLQEEKLHAALLDIESISGHSSLASRIPWVLPEDGSTAVLFIISGPDSPFSPLNYQEVVDDVIMRPYEDQDVALRVLNRLKVREKYPASSVEVARTRILFKLANLAYHSSDLEDTGKAILKILLEVFRSESAAVYLKGEEDHSRLMVHMGPADRVDLEELPSITTRIVLEQKRMLFFEDLSKDLFWNHSNWKHPEHLTNAICTPLSLGEKVLGTLELFNVPKELFNEESNGETGFLGEAVNEAAKVLNLSSEFARMHRDLQFAVDELSIMYEISDALSSTLNLDELLKLIVRKAMKSFDAQIVSLMMMDNENQELYIKLAEGISEEIIGKTRVKLGDGVAGRVAKTGQPLLLVDVMGVETTEFAKNVRSALSVPLKISDKVIGVLNVSKNSRYRFTESDLKLLFNLASLASQAIEKAELYSDIKKSLEEIKSSYMSTVRALSKAIEAKDPYTRGHVDRVAKYGMAIALELDPELLKDDMFRYALVLHDIGKIQIPDAILTKKGKLTDEEMGIMRRHPDTGAKILQPVKFLQKAADMVRYHQERWDGKGYPQGLKGDEIPLAARIIAVADAFDAITTDRPYRTARSVEFAREEIEHSSGAQFDPQVVQAFLAALDKKVIP